MRPSTETNEVELYECLDCMARVTAAETPKCPECGGELQHLGRSRDL